MGQSDSSEPLIGNDVNALSPVKQALLEIRKLREELDECRSGRSQPVSVLGLAVRLPGGVNSPDRFWQALANGENLITTIPSDRWDALEYWSTNSDQSGKMYDLHGGFIDDVDSFDAEFFGIHAREAESMDPQQRLLLELTWEAVERAGIDPRTLMNTRTGVYIGITNSDYGRQLTADTQKIDGYTGIGAAGSIAAGRIAYFFGTHGPAVVIDTACSSSLVAVHQAVQSLRQNEIDLAIVGGVNLILSPEMNIGFSRTRMLARDGQCKTFDAAADGYVRSEGCCVVVLKRQSDALRDGNHLLANIHGSAVNQDGRSAGITAPNGPAQEMVMQAALSDAHLSPSEVSYLEAHGTGTPLGDPMEVHAIGAVYGSERSQSTPLHIGSVKTNLGHTEAAAGLVGLIKIVLMMQGEHDIVPHLNFTSPSKQIDWSRWPIRVPLQMTRWTSSSRFAAVSSFGFSGTNAHVIVGAAPPQANRAEIAIECESILCLSAASEVSLRELVERYIAFLQLSSYPFCDVCRSAAITRSKFGCRLAITACNGSSAAQMLARWLAGQHVVGILASTDSSDSSSSSPEAIDFVKLGKINPNLLRTETAPSHVELPVYPFQKRRFWFGLSLAEEGKKQREQAWQQASSEARRQSRQGPLGWDLQNYGQRADALRNLTLAHAQNLFVRSKAIPCDNFVTVDQVMRNGGFSQVYHKIITRWLQDLSKQGSLLRQGNSYKTSQHFNFLPVQSYWEEVERSMKDDLGTVAYLRHCGALLEDVVTGRTSALETLFPGGSFSMAEGLYENRIEAQYLNTMVSSALRSVSRQLGKRRNVRILEIGGGTGGTTSAIVPLLQEENVEYLFTDVSELFLSRARRKFNPYPFMRFGLFNIDQDIEEQGYRAAAFDVIVAANVIHAAQNLGDALQRVHRLLTSGGMLILLETTCHQTWFDMSTGLIEGWQHFSDEERDDNPLLPVAKWQSLLSRHGFELTLALPSDNSPAAQIGQHVLMTRKSEKAQKASVHSVEGKISVPHLPAELLFDSVEALGKDYKNLSVDERERAVSMTVRQVVCNVFRLESEPGELNERDRLSDLGMDSLIALELRGELAKRLELEGKIPSTIGFDTGTVGELTRALLQLVAQQSQLVPARTISSVVDPSTSDSNTTTYLTAEEVMELTEEEVESLLKERLSKQ